MQLAEHFDRAAGCYDLLTRLNPGYHGALRSAADALVAGVDTPCLRELAAVSVRSPMPPTFSATVQDAFLELGTELPARGSGEAESLAKREHCYADAQVRSAWEYLLRRLPSDVS